jgi:hypothetical protein
MKSRAPQILVNIFFLGLLATPLVIKSLSPERAGAGKATSASSGVSKFGFRLEESALKAGIEFVHTAPTLDPKLDHIMPQIASMGAGVAVCDFDRDGRADFYVTNSGEGSKNALYRNKGDGTFEDVAAKVGVADVNRMPGGVSMGAVWGDYDNDGFEDLLVYKWGRTSLLRNEKGKKFTDVSSKAGFPDWANVNNAIWLDYDRDGKLDIFLGGYFPESVNLWKLTTTRMMPDSFEYAQNGGRKYLLRGKGDGSFEDVTAQVGLNSRRWALASVAFDLRGTGYPDIVIANDYGVTEYWLNEGGKKFREVGRATGIGYAPKSGMNASAGDILNTGQPALYVTNISEEGVLIQGNNLWVPQANSVGKAEPRYVNMARDMGVELGGWSFGAQFGDLNNDGHLDLYLTNGYISAAKDGNYWYDFSKIAGGNSAIIADAANWPPMKGRSLSGHQAKRVWLNDGAGRFNDVAQSVGVQERHDGRAVALADFSNSGALDVLVSTQRGPLLLYKNTVDPKKAWIGFGLEGTRSNRSAIGAQVRVFWSGKQQVQEVSGGSGFCAQNDRRLHFGLGQAATLEKVVVRWPSGKSQTLQNLPLNIMHRLKEPV